MKNYIISQSPKQTKLKQVQAAAKELANAEVEKAKALPQGYRYAVVPGTGPLKIGQ